MDNQESQPVLSASTTKPFNLRMKEDPFDTTSLTMESEGLDPTILVSHDDELEAYANATHRRKTHDGINEESSEPSAAKKKDFSIHCIRETCGHIVNNERVQLLIVGLITINAIMMGIGTYDFVTENPELDSSFETTDLVFLIIFTIELGMQFIYHGFKIFLDGWLVFDFIIVFCSWAFASMQVIRAFRIFRALRLITRIKDLRDLVIALLSVMPRMTAIMALLGLIFYIFAVMFTTLFKNMYRDGLTEVDYFGRLDATFYTLFQMTTLDWAGVARDCMETYEWAWAPFVTFVCISSFIVFNLIIAVICDAVAILHSGDDDDDDHQNEPEEELRGRVNQISCEIIRLKETQDHMQNSLETLARLLAESQLKEAPTFSSSATNHHQRSSSVASGVLSMLASASPFPPNRSRSVSSAISPLTYITKSS